jgi:hypothetical protein
MNATLAYPITETPEPEWPPEEEIEGTNTPAIPETPQNREAEEAVIGAILMDPGRYPEVATILKPSDFFIRRNGWVWQAFDNLTERGEPFDSLTIADELERLGQLTDIGGPAYLTAMLDQCPLGLHAPTYARKVKDAANRRGMLAAANEIATMAYNPRVTTDEATARGIEAIQENTTNTSKRYTVHNAADALAPRPPVKWIVDGLIYENSITVMYGDGGTKKTWAGMYLAACVASGAAWGDYETHKMRVLFVDEENGEVEISGRAAFCIRGALSDENADLKYISLAAFHLDDPRDEAILTAEILAQGAGLVVLDALADLMIGDENSKQDTQPVFNALRRIAEKTGAAILIIHHANKQGGHRGSSVIKDAPDILLRVDSDPESNFINFKTEKNRKGKAIKWAMQATWLEDKFYLSPAEMLEKTKSPSKAEEYVIRFFEGRPDATVKECEENADTCSPGTAHNTLYGLAERGILRRTNPGERTARYSLASVTCNGSVTNE